MHVMTHITTTRVVQSNPIDVTNKVTHSISNNNTYNYNMQNDNFIVLSSTTRGHVREFTMGPLSANTK